METYKIHKLLPKFDCGHCENPICMTFARKIITDSQKPEECRFLSSENLAKIMEMISAKEVVRKHPHPNEDRDLIEIHPCTEDGKVTLETQLKSKAQGTDFFSDFFDNYQLCASLEEIDVFDGMKCSPKMGYAFAEIKGKRTHIFGTGKIVMRRAENREDALNTFTKISRLLLPARICSCGNILVDCFAGACGNCSTRNCAAIQAINEDEIDHDTTTLKEYIRAFKDKNPPSSKLIDNFELIGDIIGELKKIDDYLCKGEHEISESEKKIDEIVKKLNKNCIQEIYTDENGTNAIIALTQYGLGRDMRRVKDGFVNLENENIDELYKIAKDIFFEAYDAFYQLDMKKSVNIGEKYDEFMSSFDPNSKSIWIFKIATNGFYISRILGKPVSEHGLSDMVKV